MGRWIFYVLECADGTYYTGITTRIRERLVKHNNGLGSKYVASRLPAKLLYTLTMDDMDRSYSQKIEARFKKLTRARKELFMQGDGRAYVQLTSGSSNVTFTHHGKKV